MFLTIPQTSRARLTSVPLKYRLKGPKVAVVSLSNQTITQIILFPEFRTVAIQKLSANEFSLEFIQRPSSMGFFIT